MQYIIQQPEVRRLDFYFDQQIIQPEGCAARHKIWVDHSTPSGLPGNDDLGAMGAWYVFASIGLYPMIPGVGGFSIYSPQFEKIIVDLPQGRLIIKGGSREKHFIQSVKLNNKTYNPTWINWDDLKNGAILEYKTSEKDFKKVLPGQHSIH